MANSVENAMARTSQFDEVGLVRLLQGGLLYDFVVQAFLKAAEELPKTTPKLRMTASEYENIALNIPRLERK
jgi:hypothetical protein